MKDLNATWSSAEAIHALFFPPPSKEPVEISEQRMLQIISSAFGGIPLRSSPQSLPQQEMVTEAVQAVKAAMPHINSTNTLHPVLWGRWALHWCNLPIANNYWVRLARWRASKAQMSISLFQYRDSVKSKWRGKARAVEGEVKLIGYTIDELLDNRTLPFDEYSVRWRIKTVELTPTRSANERPREVANICGGKAMEIIHECVLAEAGRSSQNILSPAMIKGKYNSNVALADLLRILKERYPRIKQYSENTIRRGLPAYVRSPRGRPGGLRK